tara:strand:+ start:399 stop:659 length:261 start_codon:yes stop_codon:yes gene_type:complete
MSYISVIITALVAFIIGLLKGRRTSTDQVDEHIERKIDALDVMFEEDEAEDLAEVLEDAREDAEEIDSMNLEEQADELAALLGADK